VEIKIPREGAVKMSHGSQPAQLENVSVDLDTGDIVD